MIYTTHYMEEAQRVCDRVGIIDKGRLLCVGTVDELVREHGGKSQLRIERGEKSERLETADPVREIARVLGDGGVTGVHIDRPDLESVFLTLTGRSLRD